MNVQWLIYFLLTGGILFSSCKKNREPEPVTFNGKVTNSITGLPVSGAKVIIKVQKSASNGVFNSGFSTLATTTTNSSGNYSVTVEPESPITYRISAEKSDFIASEIEIAAEDAPAGSTNNNHLSIDPSGWFRVNIKNTNPFDADDNIIFQNTSESSGCANCCNNSPISFDGESVDTFFVCKRIANPTISFSWFVTKNGNLVSFSNNVSAIHGDTAVFNLNY